MNSHITCLEDLDSNRLDAEFYEPRQLENSRLIRENVFSAEFLGNLVTDLKDGPGGWGVSTNDYVASGIPVIRGVNITEQGVRLDDCVFISEEKHRELIAHEVIRGDVVLSVRGTIGKAAVFDDPIYEKASMNAAVVRMRPKERIDPYFLVAFFNSRFGLMQSDRISNGAVQNNMNLEETRSHLIPTPPDPIQKLFELRVKKAERLRQLVKYTLAKAKITVDELIEGTCNEAGLVEMSAEIERWLTDNPAPRQ